MVVVASVLTVVVLSQFLVGAFASANPFDEQPSRNLQVCHYWDCPMRELEGHTLAATQTEEAVDLGRPREWANPNFKKFSTCPGSGATEHTMAEMSINFRNPCSEVMAEISARADATTNGESWVDPHNRGHYKVLFHADREDYIKIQRWTKNYTYRDVQTFELKAAGSGCSVKACSESQGNSNNDQGTNYCNLGNLFCNTATASSHTGVKCKSLKYNLQYSMSYLECGRYDANGQYLEHNCQPFTRTCMENPSLEAEEEGPFHVLKYLLQ